MKSLLLIDLSGIYWAAWHASANEELSAAFEKTVGKVVSLADGYDHVAVCLDFPPYRRKEKAPSYKANREAAPPQAIAQLAKVKQRLDADGFCLFEAKGYEADDVIATVCELARREEPPLAITIASSDKDLLQLVDDSRNIRALSPRDGLTYDEKGVTEKLGVPPKLVPDWLALVGDKSDGVEGVKGVGPVKATDLLRAFGDHQGVLEASAQALVDEAGPAVGAAVFAAKGTVRLAFDLVMLEKDAPIDLDAIFEKREPRPLGPKGEWDEAEFDEVLPPIKTPEAVPSTARAHEPEATDGAGSANGVAPAVENTGQSLMVPPKVQTIAVRPAEWSSALEPTSGREAWIVAKCIHESRLYPKLDSQAKVFAVVLRGRSLGLDAVTACSMFHVVKGKPVMHAELILGLVMRSGRAEYFECTETSDESATWITKRVGGRAELSITWDMERALRARLVERFHGGFRGISESGNPSNWDKYRRTMLRWRAGTELAHAVYPEIVSGLVTPDEAEGIDHAAE